MLLKYLGFHKWEHRHTIRHVSSGDFLPIEMNVERLLHGYFARLILMESCVKENAHSSSSWRTYVSEYYTSEELRKQAKRRTKMRVLCFDRKLGPNLDLLHSSCQLDVPNISGDALRRKPD